MHRKRSLCLLATIALSAATPVTAEVAFNIDHVGRGVIYTANSANATEFFDTALTFGSEFGHENVLLVLDADTMLDDLGSDQWYRLQKALLNNPGPDEDEIAADFDSMLDVQEFLLVEKAMRTTQDDMAQNIRVLQSTGYPVKALTACGPENFGTTLHEFVRNDINISMTAPVAISEMTGVYIPLDSSSPTEAGLIEEEFNKFGLGIPRHLIYKDGVYMVAGQHKGALIKILLCRLGKQYLAIVFLDGRGKNSCDMTQAFQEQPDVLDVFSYNHERVHTNAFLQDEARQAVAIRDCELLTARMPGVCESSPESCVIPIIEEIAEQLEEILPDRPSPIAMPSRPLKITTWNLEHMMSEAVFEKWIKACKPYDWDDGAARKAGKPVNLTYCNAHSGRDWPCGDRQEALALRTPEAFEKKAEALRIRATELDSDIYAFQEVSDAEAIARLLPPDQYEILFVSANIAMNVGFAVRKELAPSISIRQVGELSVCELHDRINPADPSSCIDGSFRTRPGLELSLNTGDQTVSLLNVHLKSSCRSHPVSNPQVDKLNARTCQSEGFDQADATSQYRNSVRRGCSLMRDQIPVIEAWVEAQTNVGNAFMILGDFNRDFGRELRNRMPARLDGSDANAPIFPGTAIGSVLKEISDNNPDGAYLYLIRQKLEGRDRNCQSADGQSYKVRSCHRNIDHFLIDKYWAEVVSENPRSLNSTGEDYGDKGYCAANARPSDHCPVTLEIALPKAAYR